MRAVMPYINIINITRIFGAQCVIYCFRHRLSYTHSMVQQYEHLICENIITAVRVQQTILSNNIISILIPFIPRGPLSLRPEYWRRTVSRDIHAQQQNIIIIIRHGAQNTISLSPLMSARSVLYHII